MDEKLIFVINPGSTSTKLALYKNGEEVFKESTHLDAEQLKGLHMVDQLDMRMAGIRRCLKENDIDPSNFDIIACRGGNMPGIEGGCYSVGRHLINVSTYAPYQEHAANLACILGYELAKPYGTPVIICDGTAVDEFDELAKITGIPELPIIPVNHVLNSRMVCRMTAEKLGKKYEDCNFIVCHMGGGIGTTLHRKGRLVDSVSADMGPISPERAGRIPAMRYVEYFYTCGKTLPEVTRYIYGGSGVLAHLGTQDMLKVRKMVEGGDKHAETIVRTMAYQCGKAIGELATVCFGEIDSIIITGSIAYYEQFVQWVSEYVKFIAPIEVLPGEFEMKALAAAGLRVLRGEEVPKKYDLAPHGYASVDEFYNKFPQAERED